MAGNHPGALVHKGVGLYASLLLLKYLGAILLSWEWLGSYVRFTATRCCEWLLRPKAKRPSCLTNWLLVGVNFNIEASRRDTEIIGQWNSKYRLSESTNAPKLFPVLLYIDCSEPVPKGQMGTSQKHCLGGSFVLNIYCFRGIGDSKEHHSPLKLCVHRQRKYEFTY